jgi:thiamine-triphosphatase
MVTQRSSWKSTDKCNWNVSVDLDTTDFGYAVGEVERVVHRQRDVEAVAPQVQARCRTLQRSIGSSCRQAEYFLKRNRPTSTKPVWKVEPYRFEDTCAEIMALF